MFEDVPHRPHPSFFAFGKSLGFFTSAVVFFSSVFVDIPFFVATLNGHPRDFVVPRLLTPHRQMEIHLQVLAHANKTFFVFRSYQRLHQVL